MPTTESVSRTIPVAISARHAHLTQASIEQLFGPGFKLHPAKPLSQTGQFAAIETVTLVGPHGRIEQVRLLGPPRHEDQVEISRSDALLLGLDARVHISGDVRNTPGVTIEGPADRVTLAHGVIVAQRHVHMSPADAAHFNVKDGDVVEVAIDSDGRDLVFGDVVVRVAPDYRAELHLDTDEGNAAAIGPGVTAVLLPATGASTPRKG